RELLARIRTALSLKRTIDETVDELRSTSDYLAQYGRQLRDVAILSVVWRARDPALPAGTVAFIGRRQRDAAEDRIHGFGGLVSQSDASQLVAVFEGADPRDRAFAAVDAALAILAYESYESAAGMGLLTTAAIDIGPATVGSERIDDAGVVRWVYAAYGEPVEKASRLAREA